MALYFVKITDKDGNVIYDNFPVRADDLTNVLAVASVLQNKVEIWLS